MEWRKDLVLRQWKIDSVTCQWRIDSDASRYEIDSDLSGIKKIRRIKRIGIVHARAQLEADLPDVDLCSPDTTTNANES